MMQMKAMLDQVVTNFSSGMGMQIHVKELDERSPRAGEIRGAGRSWEGVVPEVQGKDQGAQHDFVQ